MNDPDYWCERCQVHHPVTSMVAWCKKKLKQERSKT